MWKHPEFNWRRETRCNIRNNIRSTQVKRAKNLKGKICSLLYLFIILRTLSSNKALFIC
ncbi:hypothetical protein BACFIN_05406 [Bacteroides finegoldii DSM 17565]|nr:hypothetical protein BACFIN_05406 [Bacteroides finegoldii DSM 17565]